MIVRFFRFLLLVGLGYFLFKWLWKGDGRWPFRSQKKQREETPPNSMPKIIAEMKKDPICGTYIPENQAVICEFQGVPHYFCSEECKLKFQELDAG